MGDEVADLNSQVGYGPYPEQRLLLDDTFGIGSDGRSAAFEVAAICARQNLKTGFLKQAAIGWLWLLDVPLVVWSAHEFPTAQEAFRDLKALVAGSALLSRRVRKIHNANGDESIELMSGARLIFKARTSGGGRGLTGHRVILDEGFALRAMHMGALLPTLASVPDPQVVYGSSAGMLESDVLRGVRDRGRKGAPRLAYAEWLAPERECGSSACTHFVGSPGCALDDRRLWAAANPVHARRDPNLEVIAALRQALPPGEFARECLGWWDDPPEGGGVVDMACWRARLGDPEQVSSPMVLAVETTPDRSATVLVVVGTRGDGQAQVEVVEHRAGTTWVPDRVRDIVVGNGVDEVAMDSRGAASALIDDINAELVDAGRGEVVTTTTTEVGVACGQMFDVIRDGGLVHLGDPALTGAVEAAETRPLGDGLWAWARKTGPQIAPLVAATIGHYRWRVLVGDDYDVADSLG